MKSKWNIIIGVAFLFTAVLAFADSPEPNPERPVLVADLHEKGGDPNVEKFLVMNETQFDSRVVSFDFVEEERVFCFRAPCPPFQKKINFIVHMEPTYDRCGTATYIGYSKNVRPTMELVVKDHTERVCEDFRPFKWEVSIEQAGGGFREFVGNPTNAMPFN